MVERECQRIVLRQREEIIAVIVYELGIGVRVAAVDRHWENLAGIRDHAAPVLMRRIVDFAAHLRRGLYLV